MSASFAFVGLCIALVLQHALASRISAATLNAALPKDLQPVYVNGVKELPPSFDFGWQAQGKNLPEIPFPEKGGGGEGPGPENKQPEPSKDDSKIPKCGEGSGPQTQAATGNPVLLTTGEKFKREMDFEAAGAYGIGLERIYRSKNKSGSMFGPNWPTSVDFKRLSYTFTGCTKTPAGHCVPQRVTHTAADGEVFVYEWVGWTDDGGIYTYITNGSEAGGELTWNYGKSWSLRRDKVIYSFNAGGYLQSTNDAFAGTTTLIYDTMMRITRVSTPGKHVEFTWGSNNRVTAVRDPAGNEWRYGYNTAGMLTSVTSPGASPDVRTYHYEAADSTLLTGISINGVRSTRYGYQADGKVSVSGLENGEERDTFAYADKKTTVTSASGQTTVYTFVSVGSNLLLSKTSRNAALNCPAAAAEIAFDTRGYVDYIKDWNGVTADYSYDAAGKLLKLTHAYGTTAARTRENTWSGEQLVESRFLGSTGVAYAKVVYTYAGRLTEEAHTDLATNAVRKLQYAYTFHGNGLIAKVTKTLVLSTGNAATVTDYDTQGNVIAITNPLGHKTEWTGHNGLGLPARMIPATASSPISPTT